MQFKYKTVLKQKNNGIGKYLSENQFDYVDQTGKSLRVKCIQEELMSHTSNAHNSTKAL